MRITIKIKFDYASPGKEITTTLIANIVGTFVQKEN